MIEPSPHAQGDILPVKAQPGARKDAILGEHAGALRAAVSAAPERGKADAAIARVIAEGLGLKTSQVQILSGEAARDKRYLIVGLGPDELRRRLSPPWLLEPEGEWNHDRWPTPRPTRS